MSIKISNTTYLVVDFELRIIELHYEALTYKFSFIGKDTLVVTKK